MIKKKPQLLLNDAPIVRERFQDSTISPFNKESIQVPVKKKILIDRKTSLQNLKIGSRNDYDRNEPTSPTYFGQQTDRSANRVFKLEKKQINFDVQQNHDTPDKNMNSQLTTSRSKIAMSPLQKNRALSVKFNKDLSSTHSQFESFENIGQRLKLQYFGVATNPISGKMDSSKNLVSGRARMGSSALSFTKQIQFLKEGGGVQATNHASQEDQQQYINKNISTPKIQSSKNSMFISPSLSSRFYYQNEQSQRNKTKGNQYQIQILSEDNIDNSAQHRSQQYQSQHQLLQTESPGSVGQLSQKKFTDALENSKSYWGRPATEQKQRFVSLDQKMNDDIQFENKIDEENYYKRNKSLFNKNFLGKQLALNNKTCLKSLLRNKNSKQKEIKFDAKIYQKYQDYYRSNKLQNLVLQSNLNQGTNSNNNNTLTTNLLNDASLISPSKAKELTKRFFGGVFNLKKESPQNTNQSQSQPSYSEAFFASNGFSFPNSPQADRAIDSSGGNNLSGGGRGFVQTGQKKIQNNNSDRQMHSKWKFKLNVEQKNIAEMSQQPKLASPSNMYLSLKTASNLNNQTQAQQQLSVRYQRKQSSNIFQLSNETYRRSSNTFIPSFGQFDTDNEVVPVNQKRRSSQPIIVQQQQQQIGSSNLTTPQQALPGAFFSNTNSLVEGYLETQSSQNQRKKFTKITEENDHQDNKEQNQKATRLKPDNLEILSGKTKNTYEISLQKQISKQIGIDLQSCMPKKTKMLTSRVTSDLSQNLRTAMLLSSSQIRQILEEIKQLLITKFSSDYSYKKILSESDLDGNKFIERFLIFISYCLNSSPEAVKSVPKSAPQSPTTFNQLPLNILTPTSVAAQSPVSNNIVEKIGINFTQSPREKVSLKGVFRLSNISKQALRNILVDISIPFTIQHILIDDIMDVFRKRVDDSNTLQLLQDQLKSKLQTFLTSKQIIQELGGKLNVKRLFYQIFQHMEERYNVNSIKYAYQSAHNLALEFEDNKNKHNHILDYINSILSNEIRYPSELDKNMVVFSNIDFFFFKLSIQCVCSKHGMTHKQTFKLLEKIEQNREYFCIQDKAILSLDDFGLKRILANLLQEYLPLVDQYQSSEQKSLSNSFIVLENIINFITNKIRAEEFVHFIEKKFKPGCIKNGILQSILAFAQDHIFPICLKKNQQGISKNALYLQLKRKLQLIEQEVCSQIPTTQLLILEEKEQIWGKIKSKLSNLFRGSLAELQEEYLKSNRQSISEIDSKSPSLQIKQFEYPGQRDSQNESQQLHSLTKKSFLYSSDQKLDSKISYNNETLENEDYQQSKVITTQIFQLKQKQSQHSCLLQTDNLTFLKYIFDFAFTDFDIYSAFDIEEAKKYYQINSMTFDAWMNEIWQLYSNSKRISSDDISYQIAQFKVYSLLY